MAFEIGNGIGNDAGLLPPTKAFDGTVFAGATVMEVAVGFRSLLPRAGEGLGMRGVEVGILVFWDGA